MTWTSAVFVALAFVAGAVIAIQPGINGALSKRLEHPIQASVISFSVGWALLVASCLALGQRLPRPSMLVASPWWLWIGGGAVGAFFVTTSLIVAPKIGAAYWVACIVAGQMLTSLVLDHFGWVGFAKREIGWPGIVGASLVVAGVVVMSLGRES